MHILVGTNLNEDKNKTNKEQISGYRGEAGGA
jgi:hypothetical protein